MKNIFVAIGITAVLFFCSANKAGVNLPVSGLLVSTLLSLAGIVFSQKIFPTKNSKYLPIVYAWFYSTFLLGATIGSKGQYAGLSQAIYIFSIFIFFAGISSSYFLYKKKSLLSKSEYNTIAIMYWIGFAMVNFYAGYF